MYDQRVRGSTALSRRDQRTVQYKELHARNFAILFIYTLSAEQKNENFAYCGQCSDRKTI